MGAGERPYPQCTGNCPKHSSNVPFKKNEPACMITPLHVYMCNKCQEKKKRKCELDQRGSANHCSRYRLTLNQNDKADVLTEDF